MARCSSLATVIMQCHMIMVGSVFLRVNCGVKPPGDLGSQRNLTSASVVSFGLSCRIQWPVSFSTTTVASVATSFICSASSFPEIYKLFRDTHDLVEMFLLFGRVEHERRHRFAGQTETHPGSGIFPTSMGGIAFLSETRRPGDRPVQTAGLHDRLHRE